MRMLPHQLFLLALSGRKTIRGRRLPTKQEAHRQLCRMTGVDLGFDVKAWKTYFKDNRKELLASAMTVDVPAPKFARFERVVVVSEDPRHNESKGERGVIAWLDSYYARRFPTKPDQWTYVVHLPAQARWTSFSQSHLASEGKLEPESALLGDRHEISFDVILEEDNGRAEGSYRLPGEFWKVAIFEKAEVTEVRCKPAVWHKPTIWEAEIDGVVIQFPQTAKMGKDDLLRAMSHFFHVSEWAEVSGPDSMVLR